MEYMLDSLRNGKAMGVEYVQMLPGAGSKPRTAHATKLVVVSAGTFGSPAILERSGVGSKDILGRNGLEQVVDLPGVGENFIDNPFFLVPFHAKEDAETLGGIVRGDPSEYEKWSAEWHEDGKGLMGTNGIDAVIQYRLLEQEVSKIGREFAERWSSFYASSTDKSVIVMGLLSGYIGRSAPPANQKVYCTGAFITHPVSTGSVHITSANEVDSPVDFDAGIFRRKEDLVALRYAWKICREHGRRMSSYRGEYAPDHPKYPAGSAAAASQNHTTPVPVNAPDVVYTEDDNKAIDDLLKASAVTAWNSIGTCAMKPLDEGGVVDSRLNVYGVQNLKVADLSICPSPVGANTCSVAVLVGEKAAIIIGEELGIANI